MVRNVWTKEKTEHNGNKCCAKFFLPFLNPVSPVNPGGGEQSVFSGLRLLVFRADELETVKPRKCEACCAVCL